MSKLGEMLERMVDQAMARHMEQTGSQLDGDALRIAVEGVLATDCDARDELDTALSLLIWRCVPGAYDITIETLQGVETCEYCGNCNCYGSRDQGGSGRRLASAGLPAAS